MKCTEARVLAFVAVIAVAGLLTGCYRSPTVIRGEDRVVCTLTGEAYYARSGAGDTSFLLRQPEADRLCAALKP